jgi:uncharacterized protein YjiK
MILILSLITFSACSQTKEKFESPAGYDFNNPVVYKMPEELMEISGIAFSPANNDTMYAIQDEEGKIFYWKNGKPEILSHAKFGKHGDFEDVAITNIYAFVLRSDGTLFQFSLTDIATGTISNVKEWSGLVPAGEYESLYADNEHKELYILCKTCTADKNSGTLSGYILSISEDGTVGLKNHFTINTGDLGQQKKKQKARVHPSAMTFNKKTQEWYLLSSINKKLIIADRSWKVKQAISLNSSLFPQPEGITFDSDNNLYISNEAGNSSAGTILKFVQGNNGR